jgi:cellulose synthase operon protein C
MCDYIAERWGNDSILVMIHSFAARKTTPEAIQDNLHETADAFDKDFLNWLDQKTGNTVRHFDNWKEGMRTAYADWKSGRRDDAVRQALAIRDYYPDYVGSGNDYELISDFYLSTGKKLEAIQQLERYRDLGGTNVQTLEKLAQLERQSGKAKQAETTLRKLNYVYPENEETHRTLGALLLGEGDVNGAIREDEAVLALQPSDPAQSHYELARALCAAHRMSEAKDQVLIALEAAPDFKPAQQLLLQLSQ